MRKRESSLHNDSPIYINTYYVYILASFNKRLYIGVTSSLVKRIYQHKNKEIKGFTEKYNVNKLVYFEETNDIKSAIEKEKQLKHWKRDWKVTLIEKTILNGKTFMVT